MVLIREIRELESVICYELGSAFRDMAMLKFRGHVTNWPILFGLGGLHLCKCWQSRSLIESREGVLSLQSKRCQQSKRDEYSCPQGNYTNRWS